MANNALPTGARVLITGVNGYIASHIADQLMNQGFTVRGTARDQQKLDTVGATLRERNPSASFEGIVVSDVSVPGAFDEAVAGELSYSTPLLPSSMRSDEAELLLIRRN